MAILEAKNLTVCLRGKEILHAVDVALPEGRRTAIIGPNGSGKSTLLKALSGFITPAAGTVLFEGKPLAGFGKKALARKMAMLPQGAATPAELTVGELADYGRFPHRSWWRRDSAADREAVERALRQTGMTGLKDRLLATLSGGERQRAWLAMALARQPQALLLDEPTTYLDIAHQLEVMQIVSELNRTARISVVMVLHDLQHAVQYADAVVVVKAGRIFACDEPRQTVTPQLLHEVFGVTAERFTNARGETLLAPVGLSGGRR